jgi:hypothetical protein
MVTIRNRILGVAIICALALFSSGAFAFTPTEAQRMARYRDGTTLCMSAFPNNDRVYACLLANRAKLSSACREALHLDDKK